MQNKETKVCTWCIKQFGVAITGSPKKKLKK